MDLCEKEHIKYVEQVVNIYTKNKIDVFTISALNNTGIDAIINKIKNKETVISGPSGAGKSTFLNTVIGQDVQIINEISDRTNKGMHTTSFSYRYCLEDNKTAIIDTPGLREFGLWNIEKDELYLFFPDFIKYINNCKFDTCTHTHEPECAVKEAVKKGELYYERYESYYNLMINEL